MSLTVNGYSESQIVQTLRELGLCYSKEQMDKIKQQLIERLTDYKTRELPENAFALFIDGYMTDMKDNYRIRKVCKYVVVGIDL